MSDRHLLRLELANDLLLARDERRAFEQTYIDIRTNATLFENEQKRQLRSLLAGVNYSQRLGHYGRLETIAHERLKHATSPMPMLTLVLVAALLVAAFVISPALTGLLVGIPDVNETVLNLGTTYSSNATVPLELSGKLHLAMLSGTYTGDGPVNVYLRIGDTRYLVLDRSDIVGKGLGKLTGFAVLETPTESAGNDLQEPFVEPDLAISEPIAEPDLNTSEPIEVPAVPDESTSTEQPIDIEPKELIDALLIYGTTPAFDADNDGAELAGGGIDYQITSAEELSGFDVCAQWDASFGGISDYTCYGSAQCCLLSDLQSSYDNWNQPFILTGTGNYTVAARIVAFNTSDLTARKSEWQSLPAAFVEAQQKTYSFEGLCRDSCLLDGINASNAVLEIEMENGTLYLGNLTYSVLAEQEIAPINETNETNTVSTSNNSVLETKQQHAEVGKPVRWVKRVRIDDLNATLELPSSASNISVLRDAKELEDYKVKIEDKGREFTPDTFELEKRINELEGKKSFGAQSAAHVENLSVTISDAPGEVEVMYETPGPTAIEQLDGAKKLITVASDIHYTNITATASISSSSSQLYWLPSADDYRLYYDAGYLGSESKRILISGDARFNVSYLDLDSNGEADTISWVVPHLSNQTYEISITVLNPVTYLRDGQTWVVAFNTTGTANLTINSTNAGWEELLTDDNSTFDEMRFLNLSCGATDLRDAIIVRDETGAEFNYSQISASESIKPKDFFIQNYSCDQTAYFSNHMKKAGYAVLQFSFGGESALAIDPPVQNYTGGARIKRVLNGSANISSGQRNVTVTIPSINASASFLVYSYSATSNSPASNMVRGNVSSATTLDFFRSGTSGSVTIVWYVAEFAQGVNVYRNTTMLANNITDIMAFPSGL